jgi:hypothetical protein
MASVGVDTPEQIKEPPQACSRSGRCLAARREHGKCHGHDHQRGNIANQMDPLAEIHHGVYGHDDGMSQAGAHGEPDQGQVVERVAGGSDQEDSKHRVHHRDHLLVLGLFRLPSETGWPKTYQGVHPDEKDDPRQDEGDSEAPFLDHVQDLSVEPLIESAFSSMTVHGQWLFADQAFAVSC